MFLVLDIYVKALIICDTVELQLFELMSAQISKFHFLMLIFIRFVKRNTDINNKNLLKYGGTQLTGFHGIWISIILLDSPRVNRR